MSLKLTIFYITLAKVLLIALILYQFGNMPVSKPHLNYNAVFNIEKKLRKGLTIAPVIPGASLPCYFATT
jgi:hypothetical protein